MKTLSETWFAEGRIDFELKKYTLLAYLQEVNKQIINCAIIRCLEIVCELLRILINFKALMQQADATQTLHKGQGHNTEAKTNGRLKPRPRHGMVRQNTSQDTPNTSQNLT